jgi:hypothetical protein
MVDFAATNLSESNGRGASAPRVVARNLAELSHDVLTLGDLQLRLLWADVAKLLGDLVYPGVLLLVGVVLVLGSVPFALATIAIAIDENSRLTLAQASAFTLAGGLILGAIIALAAVMWIRRGLEPFKRSLAEFDQNLRWVKKILKEQAATSHHPVVPAAHAN